MTEFINDCFYSKILHGLWDIFSIFNGNPDTTLHCNNFGIRFTIGMFFSFFLFYIIKMRALVTMERRHVIAMVGALLIFIRYFIMFGFEWGWQIGLYNDPIVHFLFPPIEHFFYMLGFGCFAYYSLNNYNYYPGIIKKILPYISIGITAFFIYASITWKQFFLSSLTDGTVRKYIECNVDWQSHLIISLVALYIVIVAIFKYHKHFHFISAFWTITFIEHITRTLCFYFHFEPSWLATIFHAMQIWVIPLISLHFIQAYVIKLGYCELCRRHVKIAMV